MLAVNKDIDSYLPGCWAQPMAGGLARRTSRSSAEWLGILSPARLGGGWSSIAAINSGSAGSLCAVHISRSPRYTQLLARTDVHTERRGHEWDYLEGSWHSS
jgi:hypothetical protein